MSLPGYDAIGILAPILLVLCAPSRHRVGGEWGGAVLWRSSTPPRTSAASTGAGRRWVSPRGSCSVPAPSPSWARSPVRRPGRGEYRSSLGVILIAVGLFIRLSINESPAFSQVRESGTEAQMPIVDVLRTYPRNVLLGVGSRIGIDAAFYILAVYSRTYITANLGLPQSVGLTAILSRR